MNEQPPNARNRSARAYLGALGMVWAGLLGVGLLARADPYFRPWERLTREDSWVFAPRQRIEMQAVGDLAHVRGVRALEHPRPVVFSTDRWGFRNPDRATVPDLVVVGDSYVAGCGMSDDDTVTARLSAHLGRPVYNYSLETRAAPVLLLMDARFGERPPRLVIYAPVARSIRPLPPAVPPAPHPPDRWDVPVTRLSRWLTGIERDNGITRFAVATQQGLRYELFGLPGVIHPDGEPALALSLAQQHLLESPAERAVDQVALGVGALARALSFRGTTLIFSPIPESGSIYPELFPASDRAHIAHPSFLDVLLARVAEQGVPTIDLRPAFRAARSPYLYQRDDSHWSPLCTELTARVWAEAPAVRAALAPRSADERLAPPTLP